LFKGVYEFYSEEKIVDLKKFNLDNVDLLSITKKINSNIKENKNNSIDLFFYEKVAIGSGNYSNNP